MEKVKFLLEQNQDEFLKSWRVTDFANKISELHYKQELLDEIRMRINEGEKPQNIFVFDKSFSIHRSYRYLGTHKLNSKNGVKNLYHLGVPISLYSNSKIDAVKHIFESFSKMFTEFNKKKGEGQSKLEKNNLYFFVKEAIASNETIGIHKYQKYLHTYVSTIIEPKSQKKMKNLVSNELNNLKTMHEERYKIQKKMIELEEEVKSNKTDSVSKEYDEMVNKVSGAFERNFIKNKRPIVGIYNEQSNSVEILCKNFIKQNVQEERQFDLKNISHNSPYVIVFFATYVLAQLFYQMYINRIDRLQVQNESILDDDYELIDEGYEERERKNNEIEDIQNKTYILEENRDRLMVINTALEITKQRAILANTPVSVENTLNNIADSNINKMAKNFDQNGFNNGKMYIGENHQDKS